MSGALDLRPIRAQQRNHPPGPVGARQERPGPGGVRERGGRD